MPSKCLSQQTILSLVNDQLPANLRGDILRHLDDCSICQAKFDSLFSDHDNHVADLRKSDRRSAKLSEAMNRLLSDTSTSTSNAVDRDSNYLDVLSFAFDASLRPNGIGRFAGLEIIGFLGAGGMGIVLKAFDDSLQRHVAIKLLPPGTATSQESRQRFLREARAAASIDHEHVVTIHSVDEFSGLPYLIMQYVEGESLHRVLERRSPMPLQEILVLAVQVSSGLAAAHRKGIIHRDIKPANILIERETNKALLTDFGLAQTISEDQLTQSGHTAGTPCYMSPEQTKAESLDARSDLFSLGAVLYTTATGASPFAGKSVYAVIRNVCERNPPPVAELNPEIPIWFSNVIEKLMQKAPDQRFDSAQELVAHLKKEVSVPSSNVSSKDVGEHNQKDSHAGWRGFYWVTGLCMLIIVAVFGTRSFFESRKHDDSAKNVETISFPFSVVGTDARFASIEEAIAHANDGATIEVSRNGPFFVSDCLIEHAITIRSDAQSNPIFCQRDNIKGPAISSTGDLTLNGITLQFGKKLFSGNDANRHYGVNSLLSVQGGELEVVDCTFQAHRGGMAVWFEGHRCKVVDSQFGAEFSVGMAWACTADSALEVDNCMFASRTGVMAIADMSLTMPRLRSNFTNNTFKSESAVFILPKRASRSSDEIETIPAAYLSITASNNLFDVDSLLSLRASPRIEFDRAKSLFNYMVAWSGNENVFSSVDCFSSTSNVRTQSRRAIHQSFSEWTEEQDETQSAMAELSFGETNHLGIPSVDAIKWQEGSPVSEFGVDRPDR